MGFIGQILESLGLQPWLHCYFIWETKLYWETLCYYIYIIGLQSYLYLSFYLLKNLLVPGVLMAPFNKQSLLSSNVMHVHLGGRPLFSLLLVVVCFMVRPLSLKHLTMPTSFHFLSLCLASILCVFTNVPCSPVSSFIFLSSNST